MWKQTAVFSTKQDWNAPTARECCLPRHLVLSGLQGCLYREPPLTWRKNQGWPLLRGCEAGARVHCTSEHLTVAMETDEGELQGEDTELVTAVEASWGSLRTMAPSLESQHPGRKMSHRGLINCMEQVQFPPLSAASEIHKVVVEPVDENGKTGTQRSPLLQSRTCSVWGLIHVRRIRYSRQFRAMMVLIMSLVLRIKSWLKSKRRNIWTSRRST